tara:strand:+ start:16618 stop:17010 length:393 start_codon:yes stop_codon:yes gene_type:complete
MLFPEPVIACTVCAWEDDGHSENDWLAFTPWNEHLLCRDCIAQMRIFTAAANRYDGVMNPEEMDGEVEAEEDNSSSADELVFIYDNNGEVAEIFLNSNSDNESDPGNDVESEEEEGSVEFDIESVSTLTL